MPKALDIPVGTKFGLLSIIGYLPSKNRHRYMEVQCDCGAVKNVRLDGLTSGMVVSCGCKKIARSTTHGMTKTPEFKTWQGIRQRCSNPKDTSFPNYGGRGIQVCERWSSFDKFLQDMGERPNGFQIERNNNNGDYCPSNCIWAPPSTQANNKRSSYRWFVNGKEYPSKKSIATEFGLAISTVHRRCDSDSFPNFTKEKKYAG